MKLEFKVPLLIKTTRADNLDERWVLGYLPLKASVPVVKSDRVSLVASFVQTTRQGDGKVEYYGYKGQLYRDRGIVDPAEAISISLASPHVDQPPFLMVQANKVWSTIKPFLCNEQKARKNFHPQALVDHVIKLSDEITIEPLTNFNLSQETLEKAYDELKAFRLHLSEFLIWNGRVIQKAEEPLIAVVPEATGLAASIVTRIDQFGKTQSKDHSSRMVVKTSSEFACRPKSIGWFKLTELAEMRSYASEISTNNIIMRDLKEYFENIVVNDPDYFITNTVDIALFDIATAACSHFKKMLSEDLQEGESGIDIFAAWLGTAPDVQVSSYRALAKHSAEVRSYCSYEGIYRVLLKIMRDDTTSNLFLGTGKLYSFALAVVERYQNHLDKTVIYLKRA